MTGTTLQAVASFLSDEKSKLIYNATLTKIKIIGQLELLGFAAILTCMILMRFGY